MERTTVVSPSESPSFQLLRADKKQKKAEKSRRDKDQEQQLGKESLAMPVRFCTGLVRTAERERAK